MFLAEFFSTTLGDDLAKVTITEKLIILTKNICQTIMSEQHDHYITGSLIDLIFTLSAHSGLLNIFSLNPQETKYLSVRGKLMNGNLYIYFMHRNTTRWVVLLHGRPNNIQKQNR